MNISCEHFTSFNVELKRNLEKNDFIRFNEFIDRHPELSIYQTVNGLKVHKGRVILVIDEKNKKYARLIYVMSHNDKYWNDDDSDETIFEGITVPDEILKELNKYFEMLYGKKLIKEQVLFKSWFHYS